MVRAGTATSAEAVVANSATWRTTPAVVAIGEIGLDYHRGPDRRSCRTRWLDAQLDLAAAAGLAGDPAQPRGHAGSLLATAARLGRAQRTLPQPPGVLHAFSAGTCRAADFVLGAGFYLGIGGMLTFRRADEVRAVARGAAARRTAWYWRPTLPTSTPEPLRGRRNEPAFVCHVAERLALLRGTGAAQIALQTTANALRLFPRLAD